MIQTQKSQYDQSHKSTSTRHFQKMPIHKSCGLNSSLIFMDHLMDFGVHIPSIFKSRSNILLVTSKVENNFPFAPSIASGFKGYTHDLCSLIGNQLCISQPLAGGCGNETLKPLKSMPLAVPVIQTKGELVDVPPQVLRAGMVINTVKTTFKLSWPSLKPLSVRTT